MFELGTSVLFVLNVFSVCIILFDNIRIDASVNFVLSVYSNLFKEMQYNDVILLIYAKDGCSNQGFISLASRIERRILER